MVHRLSNEAFIRQRSDELQIPFENLLAASVIEEIVQRITESEYESAFWLKNANRLNLESYKTKVCMSLEYYMKETDKMHYRKSDVSAMFAELFKNFKKETIHWNYSLKQDTAAISANMTATINAIKVPVRVNIKHIDDDKLKPYQCEVQLFTNNNQKIMLKCFPSEKILVDKFIDIMSMMELINNMAPYCEIYDMLKREMISARRVYELLVEGCQERRISIDMKRFETMRSYKESRYMQKKWKIYLRHEKISSPAWTDVIDLIDRFFGVIWESICNNVIYLGDWMPELGRFID